MKIHILNICHTSVAIICIVFTSCSLSSGPTTEDIALQAAKVYYDQLVQGDYNAFVEGSLQGDTVPQAYKQQLLLNAQMFVEQQQEAHGGIDSIIPQRATCDTLKLKGGGSVVVANAFLSIKYKDKSHEEIVVPMVKKKDNWYLSND